MFELDEEIVTAMSCVAEKKYIDQKVDAFANDFPERFKCTGRENTRTFMELTFEKAQKYNMDADREFNGLNTMMHYLGCEFDEDPMYPWARFKRFPDKKPTERENPESWIHLSNVYKNFRNFAQTVFGEDFEHLHASCARVGKLEFRDFVEIGTAENLLSFMKELYPKRYISIPPTILCGPLIDEASKKAFAYGMNSYVGTALFATGMFLCGVAVDKDPLLLPINRRLTAGCASTPNLQNEQYFFNSMRTYFKQYNTFGESYVRMR